VSVVAGAYFWDFAFSTKRREKVEIQAYQRVIQTAAEAKEEEYIHRVLSWAFPTCGIHGFEFTESDPRRHLSRISRSREVG